jgi:hypothetical protein
MIKTKPKYSSQEIRILLESLNKVDHLYDPELIHSLESFIEHNPDEETRKLMNESDNDETKQMRAELRKFEAYEDLASEASALEHQARIIRSTVKVFKCPTDDLPKMINDDNKSIAAIAIWRLALGR